MDKLEQHNQEFKIEFYQNNKFFQDRNWLSIYQCYYYFNIKTLFKDEFVVYSLYLIIIDSTKLFTHRSSRFSRANYI